MDQDQAQDKAQQEVKTGHRYLLVIEAIDDDGVVSEKYTLPVISGARVAVRFECVTVEMPTDDVDQDEDRWLNDPDISQRGNEYIETTDDILLVVYVDKNGHCWGRALDKGYNAVRERRYRNREEAKTQAFELVKYLRSRRSEVR